MTTYVDLTSEVKAAIADAIQGGPVRARWLQQTIVDGHVLAGHIAHEWSLCCAHEAVKAAISKVMRETKAMENEPDIDRQLVLPGHKRLQRHYLIKRDEESTVVSLGEMTDDEIAHKAHEHRRQGLGHYEHADELERYLCQRQDSQPRA